MPCNCGGSKLTQPANNYHVGKALVDVATGNAEYVDEETFEKRVNICLNCPVVMYSQTFKACKICKCFIRTKARFAESSCPATPENGYPEGPFWNAEVKD